jgi:hypothetical protein
MPPVAFIPQTAAPTHLGAFRNPVPAAGTTTGTFPDTPLTLILEMAFGADQTADSSTWSWTAIEPRFIREQSGVTITAGRPDETSTADPAKMTLVLDNREGRFTPHGPSSPYFPYVKRGTPVRFRINAGWGAVERFSGFVSEWQPRWDQSANDATVTITAAGMLRRLQGNNIPLDSPMRRAIVGANPVGYWPMEEASGATQFSSALSGGLPMGQAGTLPTFAANDSLTGSKPLPTLKTDTQISGTPPTHSYNGHWQVDWFVYIPSISTSTVHETILMRTYTTGSAYIWDVVCGYDGFDKYQAVRGYNNAGTMVVNSTPFLLTSFFEGGWMHLRLMARQLGADVGWALVEFPVVGSGASINGTYSTATLGNVILTYVPPDANLDGVGYGHLAVFDSYDFSAVDHAAPGYDGENASNRIVRLCTEQGIAITADSGSSSTMAPQPIDTLVNLLRDAERTDHGELREQGFGLRYAPRSAKYNAAATLALTASSGHLPAPPEPAEDDQGLRNSVTASRSSGSSATYQDATSIAANGLYESSISVNAPDNELAFHAQWLVTLGTVDAMRYPGLALDLARNPSLIPSWVASGIGARVTVSGLPATHPPDGIDVFVEGYTEKIRFAEWRVDLNCVPSRPYEVWTVEGTDNLGKLQATDSTLAAAVTPTATSLSVATTTLPLWTTAAGDLPFDIEVGGERMTVTAISGASSPQTFTVTRSVNSISKAQTAGTSVKVRHAGKIAL